MRHSYTQTPLHHVNIEYCYLQLSQVEEYMRYRKLPQGIRLRVQEFYEHRYRKKYFDEELILNELSAGLREVRVTIIYHTTLVT